MIVKKRDYQFPREIVAIIPAAGAGIRMGTSISKQFIKLMGRPLIAFTLEKFQTSPLIDKIILVVPSDQIEYCSNRIVRTFRLDKVVKVVPGGKMRQDSVRLGLEATNGEYEIIMIHDGVRPFVDNQLIKRCVEAAMKHRAVITAIPARETIKEVDSNGVVARTLDRSSLWLVQTPQVFRYSDIYQAHRMAVEKSWENVTDDAALIERLGIPVYVIKGSERNIKITTPFDLEVARIQIQSFGQ